MTTQLIYHSLTGNTRQVAEAMARELKVEPIAIEDEHECEIRAGDLLFLGDGVYWNRPSHPMRRFVQNLPSLDGVKIALFGTYGGWPRRLDWFANGIQAQGGEILGRFSCKGRDWAFLGLIAHPHPTQLDLEAATAFAAKIRARVPGT